jgi:hypothetical protein
MDVRRLIVALVVAALVVAGCGDGPASTKYKQTWSKAYSATTCADWRDVMDEHQKFVMAADILYTSQKKANPDVALPSDSLVGQFQGQIQGLCLTHGKDDVVTVSFIVWTTGQDVFAPR